MNKHCRHPANPANLAHTAIAMATLLLCPASAWAGSAAGEEEPSEQTISPITITATKASGGLPRNLPANSAGYSAKDISEQVNVINTEDIVKYSPDTMTRKRYIGDRNAIIQTRTASVTSSARALVYADGFLLSNLLGNGFAYPARWNMVLPEEIQRVDFFFGPHSAAYPGNSTGTTVLMTTRMPQQFEATAKAQYFSEDFSQYGHGKTFTGGSVSATVGNKAGALSWLLGFNHLDSTGHPMNYATATVGAPAVGDPPPVDATGKVETLDPKGARRIIVGETSQEATRQNSFKAKLVYDLSSTLKASYMLGAWQNDAFNHTHSFLRDTSGNKVRSGYFREGGTSYKIGNNAFSENAWQQTHWMNALSLKSQTRGEWDGEASVTVYRISQDKQYTSQPDGLVSPGGTAYGTIIDKPYGDGWTTLGLRGTWRPQGSEAARLHEVAFGYHFDEYKLDTKTSFSNATQGSGDWEQAAPTAGQRSASRGTTNTHAIHVQDAWRFAPDWKLTPGLRVEQWQARDGMNQNLAASLAVHYADQSRTYRSPKLALQYALNDDWLLKAAVSRAYRLPTVTELFQAVSVGGNLITNNPDLQAERVTSAELTAERELKDGLLRVSVFTERVRDAIYRANAVIDGGTTQTVTTNLDRVHSRGLTLAYQQRNALMRGLDLTGSLTYAHARTKHDVENPQARNKVFPGVPDWRATVVGTYRVNDRLNCTLAARYSGRQSNELDNTDILPDQFGANSRYLVVDTRVTWALDKRYKLALGIDNLNNEKYYAFHPMPNRTVHLELRAQY